MTSSEFNQKQAEMLANVPVEFHSWLQGIAWDQGHSSGYENVISILEDLLYGFEEARAKYNKRIKR